MSSVPQNDEQLREAVRDRYAKNALNVLGTSKTNETACCKSGCCQSSSSGGDPISSDLYTQLELGNVPVAAALASLGCGNPTALAELRPGEKVLDLGSGGGIDVLLSAKRVGPTGFAYGLDMTDQMLELAERNRQEAGIENVKFLKGIIEDIPLPENSVDVIISNCVINLSADKGQVLREAYRVLTSGGCFAVSDIVIQGSIPPVLRQEMEAWAGCLAGALEEDVYRQLLAAAGFTDIDIEVTRRYTLDDLGKGETRAFIEKLIANQQLEVEGTFVSAFIRARKP
jgi:arsenite methyltransferase